MTRPIAPGQTVPVPFTLAETPDSTPTLTVYQSTAAGVLSGVSTTTSPTVAQLGSGLEYHAYFTVPAAAVHGSSYQLLVSVVIAGETTTHWLDGGCVDTRLDTTVSSRASQTSLDTTDSAVDANTTAIANVQTEVNKIPRTGTTHTHTNASTGATADVSITDTP